MSNKYSQAGFTTINAISADGTMSYSQGHGYALLSDGTEVFILYTAAGHHALYYSSDHVTVNLIADFGAGFSSFPDANAVSICVDNLDNIYVGGQVNPAGGQINAKMEAFAKGTGYTWTAKGATQSSSGLSFQSSSGSTFPIVWLNTGGGTNGKGHVMLGITATNPSTGTHALYTFDAGALLAGPGASITPVATLSNPACWPGYDGHVIDVCTDGLGATTGLILSGGIPFAGGNAPVIVGAFTVSSTGTFSATSQVTSYTYSAGNDTKCKLLRVGANTWVGIFMSTTNFGTHLMAGRFSSTAVLTAPVDSGQPTGMPSISTTNWLVWDAQYDSVTGKVFVYFPDATTATTINRLGISVGSGIVWDTSVTVDDTSVGGFLGSWDCLRIPQNHGRTFVTEPYQVLASTGNAQGDYTAYSAPPNPPTLNSPSNGAFLDVSAGVTCSWTFSDNTIATQSSYAFRRKVGAGAYNWWNGSTWQSTEIFNSGAASSIAFGAGTWANGNAYNWSVNTTNNYSQTGTYASDFTLNAQSVPAVSVTAPTGTIGTQAPTVAWTYTAGTSNSGQADYEVIVEHGAFGTVPGSGTQDWDSGVTVDQTARSRQVGVALAPSVSYRAFVRVHDLNAEVSAWAYTTFSISLDPPAQPTITSTTFDATHSQAVATIQCRDNLLTWNQSSLENNNTTGWGSPGNCSIAASAAASQDGAYSLALTSSAAGDMTAQTPIGTAGFAVMPNQQYTAVASFRTAVSVRACSIGFAWYTAAGALISGFTYGATVNDSSSAWPQASVTATSPPTAAYGAIIVKVAATAAAAEVHYVDEIGVAPGSSTLWTRGGLLGGTTLLVEYSDDGGNTWTTVRNAGSVSIPTAPSSEQLVTVYDTEIPGGATRRYRATVQANV